MRLACLLACLGSVAPLAAHAADGASNGTYPPDPAELALEARSGDDVAALFRDVAEGVRYEAYAGVLRGAALTAELQAGNAWDQALLLAERLRRAGYRVRFAAGPLSDENVPVLLRGMYPPALDGTPAPAEAAPFVPEAAPELLAVARDHVWVEVDQGDSWLPLDPSFPRARPGEAYGRALRRFEAPPAEAWQRVRVTFLERGPDGERELAQVEAPVAELRGRPVSYGALTVPLATAPDAGETQGRGVGGLFGAAFGGAEPEPDAEAPADAPKPAGVRVVRSLHLGPHAAPIASTDLEPGERLRREWMAIDLAVPGRPVARWERDLLTDGEAVPDHRRHVLAVLAGPVTPERLAWARAGVRAAERDSRRAPDGDADEASPAARARASEAQAEMGTATGHLIALSQAHAADLLTRRLGARLGVAVAWSRPRLLVASVAGTGEAVRVDLDLRLDEVEAWPYPGRPARLGEQLRTVRGLAASMLEGDVVSGLGGPPPETTAALMAAAAAQGVELRVVLSRRGASKLKLDSQAKRHLEHDLEAGFVAIAPVRPVRLGERERAGWWRLDPDTGSVVGVMDDGLHQAMAQYSKQTTDKLQEDNGKALGIIYGSLTTYWTVSAKILEYGSLTPQALQEIKAFLADLACVCPQKPGLSAGASVSASGCYKKEVDVLKPVTDKVPSLSFCEGFGKGMSCAVGLILEALEPGAGAKPLEVKAGIEPSVPCRAPGKAGS